MPARVVDCLSTRMPTSEANEYPGHELFLPYLVNKATTVLNVRLQKILDLQGLTLTHWRVLAFLSRQDDLTMGELASNTMTEQSTLSRSLRALETQGFVLREASPNDSRAVHVHLLAAGRAAFEHILKSVLGLEAEFTRGIAPEDIECARSVLLKIIANG